MPKCFRKNAKSRRPKLNHRSKRVASQSNARNKTINKRRNLRRKKTTVPKVHIPRDGVREDTFTTKGRKPNKLMSNTAWNCWTAAPGGQIVDTASGRISICYRICIY